jgi:hypothetical protein
MPLTDSTVAIIDQHTNDVDQAMHIEQEIVALRNASGLSQRQIGSDASVEAASALLIQAGQPSHTI